ncbi:MAG: GNAT family N-acetyltransferase [Thermoleophilia bacterium]
MTRDPTTSGLWVRPATAADIDLLTNLLDEIMAHHGVPPPPAEDLRRTLEEIVGSTSHEFLLAGAGDSVRGTCALIYTLSTWSAGRVCELQDVVVAAGSRGEGVGRTLLEAAERRAREKGCRRLFLSAETANLGGHRFYRALGLSEKAVLWFERDLTGEP